MRAVVIRQHGGPEVLQHEELPLPEPGPGQVRVRVQACALNHLDLWVRGGLPGLRLPFPHILGSDIAGVVDALGPGVTDLPLGLEAVVNPGLSCGRCRACLLGEDNLCPAYGILGEHVSGGYCEALVVPVQNIVARPAGLSPAAAAAFPLAMLTAWQMLVKKARLAPGETLLVIGAASGVGSAAVQIGKLLGAQVIATATSDEKLARARALGADDVINTASENLIDGVKQRTRRRGADVVFEHVGKALFAQAIIACARGGRIVTCGATTGYDATIDLRHVFFRQITIFGSTMGSKGDMYDIVSHIEAGRLRPVVDRLLPLAQAAEAHQLLADRRQFGKIVLTVQ